MKLFYCFLYFVSLLIHVILAENEIKTFKDCDNIHKDLKAMWQSASTTDVQRSSLTYQFKVQYIDHLIHATYLKFNLQLNHDPNSIIYDFYPLCGTTDRERIKCIEQLTNTNQLTGEITMNMPYMPDMGRASIEILEPLDSNNQFQTIYKLCMN